MKQEIVITDTNIFIDLIHLDMVHFIFQLKRFNFKTTDFIFEELYDRQKKVLKSYVNTNEMEILVSEDRDLLGIYTLKNRVKGLSIEDCSAWY